MTSDKNPTRLFNANFLFPFCLLRTYQPARVQRQTGHCCVHLKWWLADVGDEVRTRCFHSVGRKCLFRCLKGRSVQKPKQKGQIYLTLRVCFEVNKDCWYGMGKGAWEVWALHPFLKPNK